MQSKLIISNSEILKRIFILYLYNDPLYLAHLKASKVLKVQVLLQLYHSFVYPYIIYCSRVWGTASDIHIQPLIILQKKKNVIIIISFFFTI